MRDTARSADLDAIRSRLAKRQEPTLLTCQTCRHQQPQPPMNQAFATACIASPAWTCQGCGGQMWVIATVATGGPTPDDDIRELLALIVRGEEGVPGSWKCQACGFELTKAILRASDGAVGVGRRPVQDICPNDGTSLRPVTFEEDSEDANRVAFEQMKRADALEREREQLKAALTLAMNSLTAIDCSRQVAVDEPQRRAVAELRRVITVCREALIPTDSQ